MKMIGYSIPRLFCIIIIIFSACSPKAAIGYQPPVLPIKISIDTNGIVEVTWEGSVQTAIGTFSIDIGSDFDTNYESVLFVNVDNKMKLYDLNGHDNIIITLESGNYKQVDLRKVGNNWFFTVSRDFNTDTKINPTSLSILNTGLLPKMGNFSACQESCNGSNSSRIFSQGITKINIEWDYENIPYGAEYIRKWTMNGKEWIRYNCKWMGKENGRDLVQLTEPKGLHSGTWEISIEVNRKVLLHEQIVVSGNWDYWDPAGTLDRCYGLTD